MRIGKKRETSPEATLNLTPTIDVVFLLLIFFVTTIRFPQAEANIRANLPRRERVQEGTGKKKQEQKKKENVNTIRISLRRGEDRKTQIFLNNALLKDDFSHLGGALLMQSQYAKKTPNVPTEIVLEVQPNVPYKDVVKALDLCAEHRFSSVSFAMPPKGKAAQP